MRELFLDLETSGTNPEKHSILSIGMVVSMNGLQDYQSFYKEIKYEELVIAPDSIAVNGFDFTNQNERIPLAHADQEAANFVGKYFHGNKKPMAIGLNIGTFDFQFIFRYMPLLYNKLGHRSVDLNSLLYLLAEKHSRDFKEFKKELSEEAAAVVDSLGLGFGKHHALYDAMFNMSLYLLIKKDIVHLDLA